MHKKRRDALASIADLWPVLRSVSTLRFEACSALASGWNGIGTGTVKASEPDAGVVVFDEAGLWRSPGHADVRFTNVFRWTDTGRSLRLEHLRLGVGNPVFLFDMARNAHGEWREVSPHRCGEDRYGASLAVEGKRLLVEWSIVGPRKQESIRYAYW